MLAQFQSLYPNGSLISELVQIFQGKYIVRASVQIEGVTRATGLAAAETVEAAEDQARNRALMVLGIANAPQGTVASSPKPISQVQTNPAVSTTGRLNEPAYSAIKERDLASSQWSAVSHERLANPEGDSSQEVSAPLSHGQHITSDVVKTDKELLPTNTGSTSISDSYNQDFNQNFSATSDIKAQFDSPADNLGTIFGKNSENQPLPGITASNVTPFTPRSHSSSEDVTTPAGVGKKKKKSEPVDLSDVIAKTDVELQRLGWTPEQGREHLIKTYGKRGRTLLTEEELYGFLQYLQSQPDPIAGF
ncbi:MAG: hypothetical protein KME32_24450 [Mojavia pulchra JT2-VF2]|jgi:hypothetical protein|uniref:Uncharacterized protein n=1 Tax=Mojavia pulchra JT2-VF2 TaxID=287848 RepID=A0A951Q1W6_9NOST|nr:hypothetical protein [Mojavia pulchra JT2-VF2]